VVQKIESIEESVSEPRTAPSAAAPETANGEKAADQEDTRYVKLSKPFKLGERLVDRLLCDVSELSGEAYFRVLDRFRNENNFLYATSLNRSSEYIFLGLTLAELNQLAFEDLPRRLNFKELNRAYQRVQNFLYAAYT